MIYNWEIETMPVADLRKLQSHRLVQIVQRVYEKVPFYKAAFDARGLKPSDIQSIDDLHKLPITKKTDLRDNYPFALFAVPVDKLARIHASSGTTGKPTVVGYTKADIGVMAEVNARSLAAAGAEPGMRLHNAYGYGLFTGGLGLHYGGERLGMAVIPISGGMTERQLMLLRDFQPEVISCTPSYAQTLIEAMREKGMSPADFNLKYAVLGAEPWTESIRKEVEDGLCVKASNIYGLSEIMGPGVSQEPVDERGAGSHVWEDHFFPEILDPDTHEVLPEGKEGVLVFTTLTKEAFPMIRYWTNDICSLYYDKFSRRTHIKMNTIKGRADDMLIIRGVNLFHTQVEELILGIPDLVPHYQLVVTREGTMDEVEVQVEMDQAKEFELQSEITGDAAWENHPTVKQLAYHLGKRIKDNIGLSMKVTILPFGKIPRSEGGKSKRIFDKRKW
jgi:phenylacetate-CoA ligase